LERLNFRTLPSGVVGERRYRHATVVSLTSFGSCGRLASHLRADTAPNHLRRVMTAHPGWAHAGRQRTGWAKGGRSMANAERAKGAAEAYRSGDPLVYDLNEVANRVEGAMA